MQFAIVNNQRTAPSPGLPGFCPACGGPVIAKCGEQRIHHWAHRGERDCDHWWEPETEWHRNWKNAFPEEWQEVVQRDSNGEKHIADVRTAQGLTIEFQHSHLRSEERAARENFYGAMVWVVDGHRVGGDLPRFREGARALRLIDKGLYLHQFPDELFPKKWLNGKVPVYFDFHNVSSPADLQVPEKRSLWCLLPRRDRSYAAILKIARETFIRIAIEKPKLLLWQSIPAKADQWLNAQRQRAAQMYLRDELERRRRWWRAHPRSRY